MRRQNGFGRQKSQPGFVLRQYVQGVGIENNRTFHLVQQILQALNGGLALAKPAADGNGANVRMLFQIDAAETFVVRVAA